MVYDLPSLNVNSDTKVAGKASIHRPNGTIWIGMDDLRVVKLNGHRFSILKTEPEIGSHPLNLRFREAKELDSVESRNLFGSRLASTSLWRRRSATTEQEAYQNEPSDHASRLTIRVSGGGQPPLAFELQLSWMAGPHPLNALVRLW
jgi:hypothetical protein